MPPRVCNTRVLQDTASTFNSVSGSLRPATRRSITSSISAARDAASRGRCADMHRFAQDARAKLERRLDMLLGRRR